MSNMIDEKRLEGGIQTQEMAMLGVQRAAVQSRRQFGTQYTRLWLRLACIGLLLYSVYQVYLDEANTRAWQIVSFGEPLNIRHKVTLEAHIMSKCPDARDCLRDLVVPVMQEVSGDVNFVLSYIGKSTEGDDAVECKHGQEECLGNIIELCAANLYPNPKFYLGFVNCLSRDYSDIPQKELVEDCCLEHGVDFDELNDCLTEDNGAFGMDLLRNSVGRSANANVTKSCTVRLNDEIRCIRDGGEWSSCEGGSDPKDLIRDIKTLLKYA